MQTIKHLLIRNLCLLFAEAGSTEASEEAVDHLNGAEQPLHTAGCQQSDEQPYVELHHILWLSALRPRLVVIHVGGGAVLKRSSPFCAVEAQGPVGKAQQGHNEAVQGSSHTHCSEHNGEEHPEAISTAAVLFSSQLDVQSWDQHQYSSSNDPPHVHHLLCNMFFFGVLHIPARKEQHNVTDDG